MLEVEQPGRGDEGGEEVNWLLLVFYLATSFMWTFIVRPQLPRRTPAAIAAALSVVWILLSVMAGRALLGDIW